MTPRSRSALPTPTPTLARARPPRLRKSVAWRGWLLAQALALGAFAAHAADPTFDELRQAALANGTLSYTLNVTAAPASVQATRNVSVPTRDGSTLSVNIFKPVAAGRYPTIVVVTPYGKDQKPSEWGGAGGFQTLFERDSSSIGTLTVSELTPFEGPDPAYWVSKGYAVVIADGKLPDVFTPSGAQQSADLVEWAAAQSFSNGKVGMLGVSALAIVQYGASLAKPAHLKAIVPWEGRSDEYRDTAFPGGIPETFFHLRAPTLADAITSGAFDTVAQQYQIGQVLPFQNIDLPTLICGSWSDQGLHNRGSFEVFRRMASKEKWLYTHGGRKWATFYSAEALRYQTRFLDHYLKGERNGWEFTAPVRMEVRDTQTHATVRGEPAWPIARTRFDKLYLAPNSRLADTAGRGVQTVRYDSTGSDGVTFDYTFPRDTEISGYMSLHLNVSATTTNDVDLIVGVHKLDAQGKEVHFFGMDGYFNGVAARGWLRVSQRELDSTLSTPYQPVYKFSGEQKIQPGQFVPVDLAILPSSTFFRRGETLRLSIAGKDTLNYGRIKYQVLINQGETALQFGPGKESYLQIPVVDGGR